MEKKVLVLGSDTSPVTCIQPGLLNGLVGLWVTSRPVIPSPLLSLQKNGRLHASSVGDTDPQDPHVFGAPGSFPFPINVLTEKMLDK